MKRKTKYLVVSLPSKFERLARAIAKAEEVPIDHVVKWALNTLADKRGIKMLS